MTSLLTVGWLVVLARAGWIFRPPARRRSASRPARAVDRAIVPGRRSTPRGEGRVLDQLGVAVELLAVGASAGLGVRRSLDAVHAHLASSSLQTEALIAALDRGIRLDQALEEWSAAAPPATAELVALLRSADRSGVALGDALERFARDLRRRRRRAAERRARRLPVTMLLPLVSCVLPAFGLLTIVPMVAVGLSRVTDHL